jgi:hypothetical protein
MILYVLTIYCVMSSIQSYVPFFIGFYSHANCWVFKIGLLLFPDCKATDIGNYGHVTFLNVIANAWNIYSHWINLLSILNTVQLYEASDIIHINLWLEYYAEPVLTYLRHTQALFIQQGRYHAMFVSSLTNDQYINLICYLNRSRDSVVGIATSYRLDDRGV